MKIGLIDVDGHNFPNLALMKISAWHKNQGDSVEWYESPLYGWYDRVYMSKVFDTTYSPDVLEPVNAKEVVKGGTGYSLSSKLPEYIGHVYPDYSLYPALTKNTAYGYLTRGCPRACNFCIVSQKEGRKSRRVADLKEFWRGQKNIKLLDPNLLACKEHMSLLYQLADSRAWIDITQGLDARLITPENAKALSKLKISMIHFAMDSMDQIDHICRGLEIFSRYKPMRSRNQKVYILTNFNTTHQEDLQRIKIVQSLGYWPYVMIYNKPQAPQVTRDLQRWSNNPFIYFSAPNFEDYKKRKMED